MRLLGTMTEEAKIVLLLVDLYMSRCKKPVDLGLR